MKLLIRVKRIAVLEIIIDLGLVHMQDSERSTGHNQYG